MKAIYDKLILIVGVLALAAGTGFYFMKNGDAGVESTVLDQQPSGPAYSAIQPPRMPEVDSAWVEPTPQDEAGLQLYDVFTPPKIWWDGKAFIFEPPEPPEEAIPFGLALRAFEQELYRIQMEAFVGRGESAQAQIFDSVTNQKYRGGVGAYFEEIDTTIVDLENPLEEGADGTFRRVPRVTLLDGGSGKEISLTTDERRYIPDEYKIHFETLFPYPSEKFVWEEVGDTRGVGNVTFKLLDFNFDNKSATVEKTSPDRDSIEQETLNVTSQPAAANREPETVTQPEPDDQTASEEPASEKSSSDEGFSNELESFF